MQQSKFNKRKEDENDIRVDLVLMSQTRLFLKNFKNFRCRINQSIFHSTNYHQFAHQLQLKEEQENSCDVACVFI